MQVTINFANEDIAQKVLWILNKFKNDGVEIISTDDSDNVVLKNFKEGLQELKLVKEGKIKAKDAQEFLDEL